MTCKVGSGSEKHSFGSSTLYATNGHRFLSHRLEIRPQQMRLPQRTHANSNLMHGGSVEVATSTANQQQQLKQQQLPNCDIYPFVINNSNINKQTVSQDKALGLQGQNNSTSALSLNISTSVRSLVIPNSDPLVRAQAGQGGRVIFTKNGSGIANPNIPSLGLNISRGGSQQALNIHGSSLQPVLNIPSSGLQQGLIIPTEIKADILGLHRRLEPDFNVRFYTILNIFFHV